MEQHRAALRKTKAVDFGMDDFQRFVAQSHGKDADETVPVVEEISIPVPSVGRNPRISARSATHDPDSCLGNSLDEPDCEGRRGRQKRRESTSQPRASRSHSTTAQSSASVEHCDHEFEQRTANQPRKHLTVPGHSPVSQPQCNHNGRHVTIQAARSVETLTNGNHESRRGRGETVVRNFATSHKGIVNMGDSFKSDDGCTSGNTSPVTSRRSSVNYTYAQDSRIKGCVAQHSSDSTHSNGDVYLVYVIGEHGVGKSSLRRQFATSEYLAESESDVLDDDQNAGDDQKLTEVAVQVDGQQATLLFLELAADSKMRAWDDADVYLVVYAIDQLSSFQFAEQLLTQKLSKTSRKAPAFLVANKSDLVRTQLVTNDGGKSLARRTQCTFAQTSATLSHKLDELLVQIVQEASRRVQSGKSRDHSHKIAKWLGKLGGKISPRKKWHSSAKRSFDFDANA